MTHKPYHQNVFNITKAKLPIIKQTNQLKPITDQSIVLCKIQQKDWKNIIKEARFDIGNNKI